MIKMLKKLGRIIVLSAAILVIIVAARLLYLQEQGNFHAVTPGEAYRSAQLDEDELNYYVRKFGIASVVNLRGNDPGERWYDQEISTCRSLDVVHYDLGFSDDREPSAEKLRTLLKLFATAPRPILFHCKAGADRAGLVAALWKITVEGAPLSLARKQLSLRYGHVPVGPTRVLDRFLEKWGKDTPRPWSPSRLMGANPLQETGERFLRRE